MKFLPAIDLIGGRCVRLAQGDFASETTYSDQPHSALAKFAEGGAEEAHIVDLDGAKARAPRQHDLLVDLARQQSLKLQVAGGFRRKEQVARMLEAGVSRVVLGSLALDDQQAFAAMLEMFGPERITLALDVRMVAEKPMVATHGWTEGSGRELGEVLSSYPTIRHLLVTDIGKDGMLAGPNLLLMRMIRTAFPAVELQASGGVASPGDLAALRRAGAARAIVGKAIWERRFTVAEGVAHASG